MEHTVILFAAFFVFNTVPVSGNVNLLKCESLQRDKHINTTNYQFVPTFCPIPIKSDLDQLMFDCFSEIFRNCSDEQELVCVRQFSNKDHPIDLLCVNDVVKNNKYHSVGERNQSIRTFPGWDGPPQLEPQAVAGTTLCLLMMPGMAVVLVASVWKETLTGLVLRFENRLRERVSMGNRG